MKEVSVRDRFSLLQRILRVFALNRDFTSFLRNQQEDNVGCVKYISDFSDSRLLGYDFLEIERWKAEALIERQRRSYV